jgi:hypothetical protein
MKKATTLIGYGINGNKAYVYGVHWESEGVEIRGLYTRDHNRTVNNDVVAYLWFFLFLFFFHHMVE